MGERGANGIGWGLLVLCFALALSPPPQAEPVWDSVPVTLEESQSPPVVALTFDDGPRSSTTGPLLDALALREVPATFFLLGSRLKGNEDLVARMKAEGHQIGVHTFDHVSVRDLSRADFDAQVGKTRSALSDIVGGGSYWLRPPYGTMDSNTGQWAGSPIALWSVDPEDWKDDDVERIVAAVMEHVGDGDIILLHDIYHSSVEAAVRIVDLLLDQGYVFMTVEQLLEYRGITPENGCVYRCVSPAT